MTHQPLQDPAEVSCPDHVPCTLRGSWVRIEVAMLILLITPLKVLITLLTKSHDPPSKGFLTAFQRLLPKQPGCRMPPVPIRLHSPFSYSLGPRAGPYFLF